MIIPCTHNELLARLAQYHPNGLVLRPYFHGVAKEIPISAMARLPEEFDYEGLGLADAWCGLAESIPFCLRGQEIEAGWGFEIAMPVLIRDGRLDPKLLDVLSQFPDEIAKCERPFWDTLPFRGPGYGVLPPESDIPIFRSSVREDATLAAAFANAKLPSTYHVAPVAPDKELWIVVGPSSGQYISRVEVTASEASARRIAAQWTADSGMRFEVRLGAISD